jgi:hypothetical protein
VRRGGFMLIRFARYRKHRKLVKERRWKIDDKPLFACVIALFSIKFVAPAAPVRAGKD